MGPLAGLKVVEFPAIGPAPMCAMLLADMGATVIRLERQQPSADLGVERPLKYNLLLRNRPSRRPRARSSRRRCSNRPTCCSKGSAPAPWNAWGSARTPACGRTPGWYMGA